MPIPIYDDQTKSSNADAQRSAQNPATTGNNSSSHATTTSFAGNNDFSTAVNQQGQPLSKEEADRLYEERMEEEYAKREGGA